jgi:hypothetical protein
LVRLLWKHLFWIDHNFSSDLHILFCFFRVFLVLLDWFRNLKEILMVKWPNYPSGPLVRPTSWLGRTSPSGSAQPAHSLPHSWSNPNPNPLSLSRDTESPPPSLASSSRLWQFQATPLLTIDVHGDAASSYLCRSGKDGLLCSSSTPSATRVAVSSAIRVEPAFLGAMVMLGDSPESCWWLRCLACPRLGRGLALPWPGYATVLSCARMQCCCSRYMPPSPLASPLRLLPLEILVRLPSLGTGHAMPPPLLCLLLLLFLLRYWPCNGLFGLL